MSMRTIAASSPKRASASVRASSVLPTPVGPKNRKEPIGRLGSESPALALRIASATAVTASSCPTTLSCSCSSRRMSRSRSSWVSWETGMPVARLTTSAMSSAVTSATGRRAPSRGPSEVLGRDRLVLLSAQARHLFLELLRVAWLGLGAQPDPRRSLVHEVYGLIGEEAVRDVAVRELGSGNDGLLRYLHPVVGLVAVLEAPEDVYGVVHGGLAHQDRLEAALQGGVLLYVLAVLVDGGRPDDVQLAPRQSGLEHVGGIHRALGSPRPHHRVQLVYEQDLPLGVLARLVYDLLETLLELAAVLGACHQPGEVEGQDPPVDQGLRHLVVYDPLGEALHDGCLADAGVPDEDGVVLGPPGEDLDGGLYFLGAPDDGI